MELTPVRHAGPRLRTMLAELATLTRDRVAPAGVPEAAFEITAIPTALQAGALAPLERTPAGV